jgi:hypothetical protein
VPGTRIPAKWEDGSKGDSGRRRYAIGGECSNRKVGLNVRDDMPLTGCVWKANRISSIAAIVAPHTCDLVRGAQVLVTPARPASSRLLTSMFRFAARLLSVVLSLVLLQLCKAVFCPISNLGTGNFLCNRLGNCSLLDPPMQGRPMNSKEPRGFRDRVSCHLEYATLCRVLSSPIFRLTAGIRVPDSWWNSKGAFARSPSA